MGGLQIRAFCLAWLGAIFYTLASAVAADKLEISSPKVVLNGIPFELSIKGPDSAIKLVNARSKSNQKLEIVNGSLTISDAIVSETGKTTLQVKTKEASASHSIRSLPGFISILPPLFAIILAFISRQVLFSLIAGIWLGAFFLRDLNPVTSFFAVIDYFIVNAVADHGHASVLLFTLTMGGVVAVMYRSGGTHGIVKRLHKFASTPKTGQLSAWFLGIVIFFDDYANTLIVGNTMRPLTDRLRISREKLSFIVDATAAPIASIALISTWIGTEVGLIGDAISKISVEGDAYSYFLASIPYRFYPLLMLFLGFYIACSDRDLFSMQKAEHRARTTGEVIRSGSNIAQDVADQKHMEPKDGTPYRAMNALIPILTVIAVTGIGLWVTGRSSVEQMPEGMFAKLRVVIGSSDSYVALLWASLAGTFVAMALAIGQRILTVVEAFDAFVAGIRSMIMACMILVLAWSLSAVTSEIQTSPYLVSILSDKVMPQLIPVFVFVTAALIAFATGTSWGTMSILVPIAVPLSYMLAQQAGLSPQASHTILLGGISSVLAGAVLGDHCSPISDTTVMSSIASQVDHIDHVRTQMPYAIMVGVVGIVVGDIPSAFGLSPWISLALGVAVIYGIMRYFGKRNNGFVPEPVEESAEAA